MPVVYALDTSGVNPLNLIVDELHTVSEAQFRDYYFIIPNLSPFFVDNFTLTLALNNVITPLVEDVDFSFALPYVAGTRSTGKQMYGGVTLHSLNANGILRMTYQTIGGNQVADRLYVLSMLADKAYNPRTTVFDTIIGLPNAFPPTPHYQDYDTIFGQQEVITALNAIVTAITQSSGITSQSITDFLTLFNNGGSTHYLNRIGGTMTGALYLSGPPSGDLQAANKGYVDNKFSAFENMAQVLTDYVTTTAMIVALEEKVSVSGDTMTGPLAINAAPTAGNHVTNKNYVDNVLQQVNATLLARIVALEAAGG